MASETSDNSPHLPIRTERLELRAFSADDLEALHALVENEWIKDEWQSELIYALLDREWAARA